MLKNNILESIDNDKFMDMSSYFTTKQKENMSITDMVDILLETRSMVGQLCTEKNIVEEHNQITVESKKCEESEEYKKRISELEKQLIVCKDNERELKRMKIKVGISIPKITIIYIVLSSMSSSFFAFSLILAISKNIVIIHPFHSLVSLVGSIGLLITSIASIKDWREFLKNE